MTDDSPRVLQHRTVFDGRVFHLDRDELEWPDGVRSTLDIVRHRGSIVLVPQPTRATIVLIRQYRHAIGRWMWEVPAGTLEAGESLEHAARRECAEEIGYAVGRLTRLGAWYPTPGFCDELMTVFRAEDLVTLSAPVARDADERLEPRIFSLDEARAMFARGEIIDLKTALALRLV